MHIASGEHIQVFLDSWLLWFGLVLELQIYPGISVFVDAAFGMVQTLYIAFLDPCAEQAFPNEPI